LFNTKARRTITIKEEVIMSETQKQSKENAGKIAVPTTDRKLCAHFGHCEAFAIFEIGDNKAILNETYVTPPPHAPGLLPEWLSSQGVSCVLAGGMGRRAVGYREKTPEVSWRISWKDRLRPGQICVTISRVNHG
jgi:hypothetical protein